MLNIGDLIQRYSYLLCRIENKDGNKKCFLIRKNIIKK